MASKILQFLTTDVRELNWKQATAVTKTAADTGKAVLDLAKIVKEKQGDLEKAKDAIAPYVSEMSSLLDVLNSPIASVVKYTIPFAPIAVTILQIICEATKREPTLEQCVALMTQVAYLQSLQDTFGTKAGKTLLGRLKPEQATEQVQAKIRELGNLSLDRRGAEQVIAAFAETELAQKFNGVLVSRLVDAGMEQAQSETWAQRVAWNTPRFFNQAVADAEDKVKTLAKMFSNGGREMLERSYSIDRYLAEEIQPLPQELIFDETDLRYRDIYVSLQAQPLMQDGSKARYQSPVRLEQRISELLAYDRKSNEIIFIQGDAGQGKSVFCRMFSDRIHRELFPSFTPILIRLRDLRTLANNLTTTLETHLEHWDFVQSDGGWLTDRNQRFLFLLDGFDELLLQGGVKSGETGGLKEFLEQVVSFQKGSHHRFVITGRPLSLQGIDRLISQNKNLVRLALCPMQDADRALWLKQWAVKFGVDERDAFAAFLQDCPADVSDKLAREPLLLYLLGRMHRDQAISALDLQGTAGMKSKIKIYDAVINWVLERQRDNVNLRITGLERAELRQLLTEAALCVVQSGNETAQVKTLEARLARDSNNPIAALIEQARKAADVNEQKALNNLLTTFYIKPAAVDQEGSIEFAHKSFGEFLFAERLKEAIEDWTETIDKRGRKMPVIDDEKLHGQIYDLLGYGGLTLEITDYLMVMLEDTQKWNTGLLFERLNDFWERWCDGEFIDAPPENLPQKKMRLLREQMPDQKTKLGLRQVDVYTGLNILILLLGLHRYTQSPNRLKDRIYFYPSEKTADENIRTSRLLKVIHHSEGLELGSFRVIVGFAMSSANLSSANLRNTNLSSVNLSNANLRNTNLSSVNLSNANLRNTNLRNADLFKADLFKADLRNTNLRNADLRNADLSNADLSNANLRNADLRNADLRNADLSNANLSSANLFKADLSNANLFKA
ncbi:pentapeptide repeat-containing protein, partial [filamentous cyanobacterium LEGE 11480]